MRFRWQSEDAAARPPRTPICFRRLAFARSACPRVSGGARSIDRRCRRQPFRDRRRRIGHAAVGEKQRPVAAGGGMTAGRPCSRRRRRAAPIDDDDDRITDRTHAMPCRARRRIGRRRLPRLGMTRQAGGARKSLRPRPPFGPQPLQGRAASGRHVYCSAVDPSPADDDHLGGFASSANMCADPDIADASEATLHKKRITPPMFSPLRGVFGCIPISDLPHCFPITACSAESRWRQGSWRGRCLELCSALMESASEASAS
jgi:hypothetical protein